MNCAWTAYKNLFPKWIGEHLDSANRRILQETRLRIGHPPELVTHAGSIFLPRCASQADISHCINAASQYSPWSAATCANGYITAPGGHRIGVCGETVIDAGTVTGVRVPRYLCVRVARDFPSIAEAAADLKGSILLIGPPGSGKTTFLRDLIRCISQRITGSIAVVDERGELFPFAEDSQCFEPGNRTDVISGCDKVRGIEIMLRTMGPAIIAVDEITARSDCEALADVRRCGVDVLATAHAGSAKDLFSRSVYKPLLEEEIFDHIIAFKRDKSWKIERISKCTGK